MRAVLDRYMALCLCEAEYDGSRSRVGQWSFSGRFTVQHDRYSLWRYANTDKLALVVRGTVNRGGWLSNGQFWPKAGFGESGRKYPEGFIEGAKSIWDDLGNTGLRERIVYATGHSRGVPLAAINALSLPNLERGVFFASPKGIYGREPHPAEHKIINYCRLDDTVTWLPFGPRHIGATHWLATWPTPFKGDHSTECYRSAMRSNRI